MRSNDYVFVWSLIIMFSLVIIFGAASAAVTEQALGIMLAFTLLLIILVALAMMGNIIANRPQVMWERIM